MPSCVASGCDARSNKGVLLKVFPRKDLKRRQIWIERVNLPGWTPTKYSALCERHFDHEQWEVPREDGKRKLKETAVPTIFCVEHPSSDDIVAKDHSYSKLGYRQLYDTSGTSNKLCNDYITQFEHIKVEVDENSNFALEDEAVEALDEEPVEVAEDIQCTPDIYTDHDGVDPIEMVHCETNETNPNLMEPCVDPLAISQEDMKQTTSVTPNFQHTKKYLFVTKGTKYAVPSKPPEVMGEPNVDIQQPRLKVLSPEQLFSPRTTSQLDFDMKTPDPKAKKLLISNKKPLSLPPKVGVILKKSSSNIINNKNNYLQSLHSNKNTPPLLSNNLNIGAEGSSISFIDPLKAQRMLPSPPALVPTTQPLISLKPTSSPPPLIPSPEFLKSAKVVRLTPSITNKILNINADKHNLQESSKSKIFLIKKNLKEKIKINSKVESGFLKHFGINVRKPNPISNSVEVCEKLEKVFMDHEYIEKPLWRPVSIDGMKMIKESSSNKSIYRLLGNNDVKMWLTKNNRADKANGRLKTSTSSQTKSDIKKVDSVCISGSSVVVLNPFEKSKDNTSMKLISPANSKKVNLFLCAICQSSFLTIASLKKHQSSHTDTTKLNRCSSRSSSTDSADDITMIEEKDGIKGDCKPSEEKPGMSIDSQQKQECNNDTDKCIGEEDVNRLIPPNVQLKKLVLCIPKLNLIPETKMAKQNTVGDMKKYSSNERILRNMNKKYSLRSKSKLISNCRNIKSKKNKKQTVSFKTTVMSATTGPIIKESNKITKETLLNIKINRNKTTENSDKTTKAKSKLQHTRCSVFVKKQKEQSNNLRSKHLCNICGKSFTKKLMLQSHVTEDHTYREEKCFKCKWKKCKMMFTSKSQSEKHSKTCSKSSF